MPDTGNKLFIGTSGWSYPEWKGSFYPAHLKPQEYLPYYTQYFSSVEIDATFHNVPSLKLSQSWNERTPAHFRFCPKMPRFISHEAHLQDCQSEVTLFLQSLGPIHAKLGRILLQLPASFHPRQELILKRFILVWPDEFPLSVDFRHPGWYKSRIAHFLKEKNIPWTWTDGTRPGDKILSALELHPRTSTDLYIQLTGDLLEKYPRMREYQKLYGRIVWDRSRMLEQWATTLLDHTAGGGRTFCFLNNHYEGLAPLSALRLTRFAGQKTKPWPDHSSEASNQLRLPGTEPGSSGSK